jgi:hypothetical protein
VDHDEEHARERELARAGRKKVRRSYSRNSIGVWFRVFRTMTRDAMVALDLPRDPTLRVSLPEPPIEESCERHPTIDLTEKRLEPFFEPRRWDQRDQGPKTEPKAP